jgi:hypothetical protein
MEKTILWGDEIGGCFASLSEKELDNFLSLVEFIQKNGIAEYINDKTLEDADLWAWLFSRNDFCLNDIKKTLLKKIEKAGHIDSREYERKKQKAGHPEKEKVLILYRDNEKWFCVLNEDEYYNGVRMYLRMEKKDEFSGDLQDCFSNIYFVEGIDTSINTLNRKFEEIRDEIVDHLSVLDSYKSKFEQLLNDNKSYRELADCFYKDTGIHCSTQAGRPGVSQLKIKLMNDNTGREEDVNCELHTKFKKLNIDRENQDRIYFCPGKKGVKEGRIIVKYIGDHL